MRLACSCPAHELLMDAATVAALLPRASPMRSSQASPLALAFIRAWVIVAAHLPVAEALPALLQKTQTGDAVLREHAIEAAACLADDPKAMVPILVRGRKDTGACLGAAVGLWHPDPDAREAVPALIEALKAEGIEDNVAAQIFRGRVILALMKKGPAARAAAPALRPLTVDADPGIAAAAREALKAIEGK